MSSTGIISLGNMTRILAARALDGGDAAATAPLIARGCTGIAALAPLRVQP